MGLMTAMFGWTQVLKYRIVMGPDGTIGVQVSPSVAQIPEPDFVRLWVCYQVKIIHTLGGPDTRDAAVALGWLRQISGVRLTANTDVFKAAGLGKLLSYAKPGGTPLSGPVYSGEFYAKGGTDRMIQSHLPTPTNSGQVLHSALAMMQYALNAVSDNDESLELLRRTAVHLVELYSMGAGRDAQSFAQLPTLAYFKAFGIV